MKKIIALTFALFISTFFSYGAEMPPVTHKYIAVKSLRARLLKGEHVTILDARSSYAYEKEHITGSISLPLSEVKIKADSLLPSKNDLIVTYCSCPHHIAEMAADVLKELGYTSVFVLDEGLPGWVKMGYPLSGELANKPIKIYWVVGFVRGPFHKPMSGVEVRVYQPATDQLEIGNTGKDGFYAMPLRFYGLQPGDQLQASLGGDTVFFPAGKAAKPWGIRIDDQESHVVLRDDEFLKTFKSRKLGKGPGPINDR